MTPAVASRGRLTLLVVGVLLLATAAAAPGAAQPTLDTRATAPTAGASPLTTGPATDSVAQQSNNTTAVRHRDPDTVNEDGNLNAVENQLARQLNGRLEDSAVEVEQGEYERARSLLGDEYDQSLEQYVDVAGETGNEDSAAALQTATRQQRSLGNETEEYQTTRERYQEAKRTGDEERARRLARQLEHQSENITQQATALNQTYDSVENSTGSDLTTARTSIQNISRTVQQQQSEIRETEFTETRLWVSTDRQNVSFDDPVTLTGGLETVNGTPIENETITLRVAGHEERVETNASGNFSLTYRPRTMSLSATTLSVAYLPADFSPYFGSNGSVPLTVNRQVEATLTIEQRPQTAAYDERLVVAGAVQAANQSVSDIPVRIVLGETRLGVVRTNESGIFRLESRVPAGIADGEQSLSVTLAQADRAVTATETRANIEIATTETMLSITVDQTIDQAVVAGRLQAADGVGIGGQPVAIRTDGTTQRVVETNETGWYRATIPIEAAPETSVAVDATFDRPTTNLEASTASAQLAVAPSDAESGSPIWAPSDAESGSPIWAPSDAESGSPIWTSLAVWGVVLVGVLGAGTWYLWRRRRGTDAGAETDDASSVRASTETPSDAGSSASMRKLEAAESAIATNPDMAIQLAYGALRSALSEELSTTGNRTHWEFHRACKEAGIVDSDGTLRSFTEWYEQAAYSQRDVEQSTAKQALETAKQFVGETET